MAKRKKNKNVEREVVLSDSAHVELEAVSLCLKDIKAVDYLLERHINTDLLGDYGRELKFIIDHRLRYGKIPSQKIFSIEFPNAELCKPGETVQYYYDAMRTLYEERSAVEFLENAEMSLQSNDFSKVRTGAVEFIDKFNTVHSPVTGNTTEDSFDGFMDKYTDTRKGIPYPWPTVTRATRGKHPGNVVIYTGISKSGKTFTAMKDCTDAYSKHGSNVLCISLEMSEYEMLARHYATLGEINYTRWTRRDYKKKELSTLIKTIKAKLKVKKKNWFRIITRASSSEFTGSYNLNWVKFLITKYKPDLVWIDGMYLLEANTPVDHGGWRDLQQNSRGFKNLMLERNLTGVATVQMGRGSMGRKKKGSKPQDKDIGGTISYLQDADVVFALNRTDELRLGGQNQIHTLVARECPIVSVTFNWHLNDMNFDQTMGEIEGEETIEALEASEKSDKDIDF